MTNEATDDDLAMRAAQGDRHAYGVLVRRHAAALAQAARGFGVPDGEIDDVVQEAFVAAWRHLATYDSAWPFRGWLFRIAVNKMRDLHRYRRVRRFLFGASTLDGTEDRWLADDQPDPERRALAIADLARINLLLDDLDRAPREALVLTAIVGMSQPEAALALGTSIKGIEGRVARARRRLAALLDENLSQCEGEPGQEA